MILLVPADEALRAEIQKTTESQSLDLRVFEKNGEEEPLLSQPFPRLFLVDLGAWDMDAVGFIQKLKENPSTRMIPLVAFGNSLRADLLQDAQEAGADLVLPKSAFRDQLPGILRHFAKTPKN